MLSSAARSTSLFLVAVLVAGCGSDPEHVQVYKCSQSAMYLDRNEDLMRKAAQWRMSSLPPPETKEDVMRQHAERSRAMGEVMADSGALDRSALRKWYETSYCESMLNDYLDYARQEDARREAEIIAKNKEIEKALLRQVAYYSKSQVDPNTKEVSCKKFNEQVAMTYRNTSAAPYRNDLSAGLHATLNESSYKLPRFQQKFIAEQSAGPQLANLAQDIASVCPADALLSDRIKSAQMISSLVSSRSSALRANMEAQSNDKSCGELSDAYCMAELRKRAAMQARSLSRSCDASDDAEAHCLEDANAMYVAELRKLELETLYSTKEIYARYIANPMTAGVLNSSNARAHIEKLAEGCLKEAPRGSAFWEARTVCLKKAEREFVRPQELILEKMNQRIAELEG